MGSFSSRDFETHPFEYRNNNYLCRHNNSLHPSSLKEPLGVGTVANVLIIGLVVDLTLALLDDISNLLPRIFATLLGPIFVGLGSGFYIGTNLGPGPRDGLMTALNRRGLAIWKARTIIEGLCVLTGVMLGGNIRWGTIWFLFSVGPSVQFS